MINVIFALAIVITLLLLIANSKLTDIYKLLFHRHEKEYSNYPVFDYSDIKDAEENALNKSKQFASFKKIWRLLELEKDVKYNKDRNEECKKAAKKYLEKMADVEIAWERVQSMIEGNFSVISGKKSIKDIKEEFSNLHYSVENMTRGKHKYEAWLNFESDLDKVTRVEKQARTAEETARKKSDLKKVTITDMINAGTLAKEEMRNSLNREV